MVADTATQNGNAGAGVQATQPADLTARLGYRLLGHRTGVQDDIIGELKRWRLDRSRRGAPVPARAVPGCSSEQKNAEARAWVRRRVALASPQEKSMYATGSIAFDRHSSIPGVHSVLLVDTGDEVVVVRTASGPKGRRRRLRHPRSAHSEPAPTSHRSS